MRWGIFDFCRTLCEYSAHDNDTNFRVALHIHHRKINMKSCLLIVPILLASLTACSTTIELTKVAAGTGSRISMKDNRLPAEREYRRDSVLASVQYFGDQDFSAPPLDQFSTLLGSRLAPGMYDLEIIGFRVIDIFPQRLGAGTAGAVAGALGSMGYSAYVSAASRTTQDNITCLVGGHLQAKPFNVSASVPYRISPFAGMVKNDPAFKGAVNECLGQLAETLSQSM